MASKTFFLFWELLKRDIYSRYRGSFMGVLWSFLIPLLNIFVYTFVFSQILNSRWVGSPTVASMSFTLVCFSGLMLHSFTMECLQRSPSFLLGQVSYIKKVVFPLSIFPWIVVGTSFFHLLISFFAWICVALFQSFVYHTQPLFLSWFLFPVIMVPWVFTVTGITFIFMAIGVFIRDLSQLLPFLSMLLLFLSPIFYPPEAIPEAYQWLLSLNPLSIPLGYTRSLLLEGELPAPIEWMFHLDVSLVVLWVGWRYFKKLSKGFADVL